MVLYGVVDITATGVEGAVTQAAGFETALANWAADCAAHGDCPVHDDPIGAVEAVMAQAEAAPIDAPDADRDAGPGEVTLGITDPLYNRGSWDSLSDALAEALDGDGSELVDLADGYLSLTFEIYFAVSCLDSAWPKDVESYFTEAAAAATGAPHFGSAIVLDYIRCGLWPAAPDPLPVGPAAGAPPIVVVSTTGDPATPYQAGVDLAARLASGVLVTVQGEGHGQVFQGNDCLDDLVSRYFVDGTPPADGATC
jgi:hypothetical protein